MNASRPLLSRSVVVTALPDEGVHVTVEADASDRAALAQLNELVGLPRLVGEFDLKRDSKRGGIAVRGEVSAAVIQTCTVSLDPFESELREDVDLIFLGEDAHAKWVARHAKMDDADRLEDDEPDVIADGRIDVGALTAEFLALGLDPYPRKPGVEFQNAPEPDDKNPSPFAVLAKLQKP